MSARVTALISIGVILTGAAGAADEGPSMDDLRLLTVPREELPAGEAELAEKLDFARALILGGKPEGALDILDEVASRDVMGKFTAEVLYYRGFALDAQGNYAAAASCYEEALALRPGDRVITLALGQTRLNAGEDAGARTAFEDILAKWPDDSQALTGLAYLDMKVGNNAAAEEKLTRAVAADDKNALALSYLGLLEMNGRRYDAARAHLEAAVQLAPANLTANYNLAGIYLMQREFGRAEFHYRRVVAKKPADGDAWYYLALALEAQGKFAEALAAADEAVKNRAEVGNVIELVDRLEKKAAGTKK